MTAEPRASPGHLGGSKGISQSEPEAKVAPSTEAPAQPPISPLPSAVHLSWPGIPSLGC